MDRFSYAVTDSQGLTSAAVIVEVMVLDFAAAFPFTNSNSPLDVNADGFVTAIDALLVINQLNQRATSQLPTNINLARSLFGYVDANANGSLEPLDVLLVVNSLNRTVVSGEGENRAVSPGALAYDEYFTHKPFYFTRKAYRG